MAKGTWTPKTPWLGPDKKTLLHWPRYVCRNASCRSYGSSHPNCRCGAPSSNRNHTPPSSVPPKASGPAMPGRESYASGGEVHFCDSHSAHSPDCQFYADGGTVEQNNEFINNPSAAIDHSISHHGLHHSLTKFGSSKSPDENRVTDDLMNAHSSGRATLKSHSSNLLGKDKLEVHHDKDKREALKSYVNEAANNPMKLLETGGSIGIDHPTHAGILAARASSAVSYLDSIKPKNQQAAPLDPIIKPSKFQEHEYDRQVDIAENPFIVYKHLKSGTLQPQDIQTIQTIYPQLHKKMQLHAMDSLIEKQMNGGKIPYRQQASLSLLLGMPLDYTFTQQAMASIMLSNSGAQTQSQGMPGKSKSGATQATQGTMERVDKMYEDKLDRLKTRD